MFQRVLYGKKHKPKELIDSEKRQQKYNSNRAAENEAQKFRLPLITGSYPKVTLFTQWPWDRQLDSNENGSIETPAKPIAAVTEGNLSLVFTNQCVTGIDMHYFTSRNSQSKITFHSAYNSCRVFIYVYQKWHIFRSLLRL